MAAVNPTRIDPYRNFRFRVSWDGSSGYVAGVSNVSALKSTSGPVTSGSKSPGQTEFEVITLERGLTHDTAFTEWAVQGADQILNKAPVAVGNFRRDLVLDIYNEADQLVERFQIFRAWTSEFTAVPELDAESNTVAIKRMVLQNEGFKRETVGKR